MLHHDIAVTWLQFSGTRSLHGTSLHAWAKLSVSERERGFRVEPFTEHPNAGARDETRAAAGDPEVSE